MTSYGICNTNGKCVGSSTAKPRDVSGCLVSYWQATGKCVLSSGASGQCNVNMQAYKVSCCNANNNQECETSDVNNLCYGGKEGEPCGLGVDGTAKQITSYGVCDTKGKCVGASTPSPSSVAGENSLCATWKKQYSAGGADWCKALKTSEQMECTQCRITTATGPSPSRTVSIFSKRETMNHTRSCVCGGFNGILIDGKCE